VAKHTYTLQVRYNGEWTAFPGGGCGREFGIGYVFACRERPGPRSGIRLVRDDGRVIEEAPELTEASIGLVVGFPSAEQYRAAAARCIARAEQIEEMAARQEARRG